MNRLVYCLVSFVRKIAKYFLSDQGAMMEQRRSVVTTEERR